MKLVFAIVNNDDGPIVSSKLTKEGYQVTKIASTGGFLMSGNTTFISGVDDDKVDHFIEIIRKFSQRRTHASAANIPFMGASEAESFPIKVTVGGATVFVMNVERFEKI